MKTTTQASEVTGDKVGSIGYRACLTYSEYGTIYTAMKSKFAASRSEALEALLYLTELRLGDPRTSPKAMVPVPGHETPHRAAMVDWALLEENAK